MKKIKYLLAFLALLPFSSAFAQEGEILYTDFDPDPFLYIGSPQGTMTFDLDYDSIPDICMHHHWAGTHVPEFELYATHSDFLLCIVNENDTISLAEDWRSRYSEAANPERWIYMGFRSEIDGDYYYGWFKLRPNHSEFNWYFDKFAYCTVPNYPLVWGQIEFWDIEENKGGAFGKLHPNPTTGIVRIEGENASEVQVFNALGQLVKTVQNANEVSLEGLPQGVYLLRVTLEGGKVFSDKVVKE